MTPNPITTPILLAIALFAYANRHRNDPPFAQQWYRGCGWDLRNFSTALGD